MEVPYYILLMAFDLSRLDDSINYQLTWSKHHD